MKKTLLLAFGFASFYATAQTPITDTSKLFSPEAQAKYNEGVAAYESNKTDEALTKFSQAIMMEPKFVKAYNNRANMYFQLKRYDEAIEDFNKINGITDTVPNTYFMLGQVKDAKGDLQGAIEEYGKGIAKKPKAESFYNRGVDYFQVAEYEKAIADFDKAIGMKSDYAYAYNDRGSAKKMNNDLSGAAKDYERAILINPKLTFAYNNLGSVYRAQKKYQEAIAEYNNAIRLKPDYYIALNNKGLTEFEAVRYEDAVKTFTQCLALKKDYSYAYNNRAAAYLKLQKFKEAIADADKAISLYPEYGAAYLNRGIAREMTRDLEGACADWLQGASYGIESAESYYNSNVCEEVQKYKEQH